MSKKLHSVTIRGHRKEWSVDTYIDPKHASEWREDGLEVDEIINSVPEGVMNMGLSSPWMFFQDIINLRNPFGGKVND